MKFASILFLFAASIAYASGDAMDAQVNAAAPEANHAGKKLKKSRTQVNAEGKDQYVAGICQPTGSSREDAACEHRKFEIVEALLSKHYAQLLGKLDAIVKRDPVRLAELKPRLIAAQETWIRFRESQCSAVAVWYTNGTLQGALYDECMRSFAERRIKELDSFTDYRT